MDHEESEGNYWPGFVDVLSNLVLVLVFVLIVFVIAINYLSKEVERDKLKKFVDSPVKESESPQPDTITALKRTLAEKDKKLEELSEQLRETDSKLQKQILYEKELTNNNGPLTFGSEKKPTQQNGTVTIKESPSKLVFIFNRGSYNPDDESKKKMTIAIRDTVKRMGGAGAATVLSLLGDETVSEAKRISYYRLLLLRNMLLDNGIDPNKISPVLDSNTQHNFGSVEVSFKSSGVAP